MTATVRARTGSLGGRPQLHEPQLLRLDAEAQRRPPGRPVLVAGDQAQRHRSRGEPRPQPGAGAQPPAARIPGQLGAAERSPERVKRGAREPETLPGADEVAPLAA